MPKIMLINVTHAEESRVGIVENGQLESFEIESFSREHLKGNIYKGTVRRIHPAIEAAFVDIGAERDAFLPLDEICFRNLPSGRNGRSDEKGRRRIKDVLKSGDEVLVQIIKEQFTNKPPTLSTFYSLPGRYLVLLPGSEDAGISRKIEGEERVRVREMIERLNPPAGCGIIVRTAAGFDEESGELERDLVYLQRLWESIRKHAETKRAPSLIYREHDLVLRNIRDYFTPDINEIFVDNEDVFERAKDFLHNVMPGKEHLLHLYQGEQPIFSRFGLETQIESIYKRRVQLRSGGSIVIDGTEALTAIDVNSGGSMRGTNQEDTAYKTNLEAAVEIGRQLRLRDLGGIVVIDFIDMRTPSHINDVERALRDAMRPDKARHDIGRISRLGLLEISRQRLRPAATASSYTACPMCEGHGAVRTVESAALVSLRKIHNRIAEGDVAQMKVGLPRDVAMYLLNQKRDALAVLESRYAATIQVVISDKLMPHQSEIETRTRDVSERAALSAKPGLVPSVKPGEIAALEAGAPINGAGRRSSATPLERPAAAETAAPARRQPSTRPARDEQGEARLDADGRPRRRRRRGGRGRRGAEDQAPSTGDASEAELRDEPVSGGPLAASSPFEAIAPTASREDAVETEHAPSEGAESPPPTLSSWDDSLVPAPRPEPWGERRDWSAPPSVTASDEVVDSVARAARDEESAAAAQGDGFPSASPDPTTDEPSSTGAWHAEGSYAAGTALERWEQPLASAPASPVAAPNAFASSDAAERGMVEVASELEAEGDVVDVDDRPQSDASTGTVPGLEHDVSAPPRRRRRRGGKRGGRSRHGAGARAENGSALPPSDRVEAPAVEGFAAVTQLANGEPPADGTDLEISADTGGQPPARRRRSGATRRRRGRMRHAPAANAPVEPPADT